ncbi:MAG: hypothetical protein KAQ71_21285, partial [Desulfobulbaceae bacterium]|nr:hypothetical protein [Desulfobulbaceae bacterium]
SPEKGIGLRSSRRLFTPCVLSVLPCCHNLKESSTGGLEGWMDKSLAVDTVRAVTLRSKGYKIVTQKIPDDITPKNRLLMGEYLKSQSETGYIHE